MPTPTPTGTNINTPYQATYNTPLQQGLTKQGPVLDYATLNQRLEQAKAAQDQRFLLDDLKKAQERLKPAGPTPAGPKPAPLTPSLGGALTGALSNAAGGALLGGAAAALGGGDIARGATTGAAGGAGYGVGAAATAAALGAAGVGTIGLAPAIAIGLGGLAVGMGASYLAGAIYDEMARQLGWKQPGDADTSQAGTVQPGQAPVQQTGDLGKANAWYLITGTANFKFTHDSYGVVGTATEAFQNVRAKGPLGGVSNTGPAYSRVFVNIANGDGLQTSLTSYYYPQQYVKTEVTGVLINIVREDGTSQEDDRAADPNGQPGAPGAPGINPTQGPGNFAGPGTPGGGPPPIPPGLSPSPTPVTNSGGSGPSPRQPIPTFPLPPGTNPTPNQPTPSSGPSFRPTPDGGGSTGGQPDPIPGQPTTDGGGSTGGQPDPIPGQPITGPGNNQPTPNQPTPTPGGGTTTSAGGNTYYTVTTTTSTTNNYTTTNNYQQINNNTTVAEKNDQLQQILDRLNKPETPTTNLPPQPDDRIDKILANTYTTLNNQASIITKITNLVADTVTAINPLINGVTSAVAGYITNAIGVINPHTTSEVNRVKGEINAATTSTVNNATNTINNATTNTVNNATNTINNATTNTVNNATTTTVTQNPTDLSGVNSQLQQIITLSQNVKEDTTSLGLIIGTLGTTAFLTQQFNNTNTKIDNIQPSPCAWPADRNTVITNGNTANTTLGTITNTQLVQLDTKVTATSTKVGFPGDATPTTLFGQTKVTDNKIGVPGTINQTSLFGLIGLPGGVNTATIWGFMEKSYRSLYLDRVYNALSILLQVHNAAMLSRNLAESIGQLINSTMTALKLKDEKDQELDVPAILGKGITDFLKSILGEEIYNGLSRNWKLASAIYTAAINTYERLLSVLGGIAEGLEILSKYTGKIGNALKKSGTVLENSYQWMDENIRVKIGKLGPLDSFTQGTQNLTEVTDNLTEVAEIVQETQESYTETQREINEIRTQITTKETERKTQEDTKKADSLGPSIDKADLTKPGS